jgi:hypothetical protein
MAKAAPSFVAPPPMPILQKEYVNGNVTNGEIRYYYFPINYPQMGDSLILLNKTQIFGADRNGDSKIIFTLQKNINM